MKQDPKLIAEKALSGDKEAMATLIIISPSGHKGALSDEDYAKKVAEDDGFRSAFGPVPEKDDKEMVAEMGVVEESGNPEVQALASILSEFIPDQGQCLAAAKKIIEVKRG